MNGSVHYFSVVYLHNTYCVVVCGLGEPGTDDSVTSEDSQQSCEKSSPATTGIGVCVCVCARACVCVCVSGCLFKNCKFTICIVVCVCVLYRE